MVPGAVFFEKIASKRHATENLKGRLNALKVLKRLLIAMLLLGILMFTFVFYKLKTTEFPEMVIEPVPMGTVADGVYTGEMDAGIIYVKAEVEVQDHRLMRIELLEHRHGRGEKGEAVITRMMEAQSLEVQDISGATYSSKSIRKAVENALRQSPVR